MRRLFRALFIASALASALGVPAATLAADSGAAYGACVSGHAVANQGFSGDHNPGVHRGFAGWPGCMGD